jgi:hypothetical protein
VKTLIVETGIKRVLYHARNRTGQAERLADSTDPGARKELSEHLLWCRKLVDKAFKRRRPARKTQVDTSQALLDLDL